MLAEARYERVREVDSTSALDRAIAAKEPAIAQDFSVVAKCMQVDAIIEVTGSIEYGAEVVLRAIEHGKHVILMNAELDGTLGPVLKHRADSSGVVYTFSDGDQPGVTLNLFRFVCGIGVVPVLCGNIKGLHDPYRNPTAQERLRRNGASVRRRWLHMPTERRSHLNKQSSLMLRE